MRAQNCWSSTNENAGYASIVFHSEYYLGFLVFHVTAGKETTGVAAGKQKTEVILDFEASNRKVIFGLIGDLQFLVGT